MATPAETHAELAIQAMQSGKDVFVEKPMALSISDAEAMQKVANETGRILMVGHLLEYHPAVLKLRGTDKLRRTWERSIMYIQTALILVKFVPRKMPFGALLLMM